MCFFCMWFMNLFSGVEVTVAPVQSPARGRLAVQTYAVLCAVSSCSGSGGLKSRGSVTSDEDEDPMEQTCET